MGFVEESPQFLGQRLSSPGMVSRPSFCKLAEGKDCIVLPHPGQGSHGRLIQRMDSKRWNERSAHIS